MSIHMDRHRSASVDVGSPLGGGNCWLRPKESVRSLRGSKELAEWEADAEARRMNDEFENKGFKPQISMESTESGSTHCLSELSSLEFLSRQCSEIDAKAAKVVVESKVKEAIQAAVAECQFCVTIGDPRDPQFPLIAVSDRFEAITGYTRSEIVGRNCRILRDGCHENTADLVRLRSACETGDAFSAVIENRRKSGDLFLNLLDLRGLTVAQNPWTGEELWFLVGIQADVTHVSEEGPVPNHLPALREIADGIRAKLVDELSTLALAGALMTNFEGTEDLNTTCDDAWCILPEPIWKPSCRATPLVDPAMGHDFDKARDLARWPSLAPISSHKGNTTGNATLTSPTSAFSAEAWVVFFAVLGAALVGTIWTKKSSP